MDIRIRITKATAELLEDAPLDKVSVSDICRAVDFSRQAFYRRFEDKYDIGVWYFGQLIERSCRQVGLTVGWRTGYLAFFEALQTNVPFHRRLLESRDYNAIYRFSRRSVEETLPKVYEQRCGRAPGERGSLSRFTRSHSSIPR